jgi:hypothetical protein
MATNNTNNADSLYSIGAIESVNIRRPRRECTDRATIDRHREREDEILHNHSSDWWAMVRASPRVKIGKARRVQGQKKGQKKASADDR